jgi:hypothetical protein
LQGPQDLFTHRSSAIREERGAEAIRYILLQKYFRLFKVPHAMPSSHAIDHSITLQQGVVIPNETLCKTSLLENKK